MIPLLLSSSASKNNAAAATLVKKMISSCSCSSSSCGAARRIAVTTAQRQQQQRNIMSIVVGRHSSCSTMTTTSSHRPHRFFDDNNTTANFHHHHRQIRSLLSSSLLSSPPLLSSSSSEFAINNRTKSASTSSSISTSNRRFFSTATTTPKIKITENEVRDLFTLWNNALGTLDSNIVAKRYASNSTPLLLPTVSDVPRTNHTTIKDYFDVFLQKKPQGRILEGHVQTGDNWAQDAGIYEFTMGIDGSKVKARYTFTYTYEDGEWKILHHHSSMMPEEIMTMNSASAAAPQPDVAPAKDDIRNLFSLWNNALATLDSDKVAMRYSKEAVLLPTVSDKPRTNYELIKDYFNNFLLKKPQGTILESYVTVGTNWAQDAGIYEFTMGIDGSKVRARYSFIYVYEDSEWKISHHHSSVMPEEGGSR